MMKYFERIGLIRNYNDQIANKFKDHRSMSIPKSDNKLANALGF